MKNKRKDVSTTGKHFLYASASVEVKPIQFAGQQLTPVMSCVWLVHFKVVAFSLQLFSLRPQLLSASPVSSSSQYVPITSIVSSIE